MSLAKSALIVPPNFPLFLLIIVLVIFFCPSIFLFFSFPPHTNIIHTIFYLHQSIDIPSTTIHKLITNTNTDYETAHSLQEHTSLSPIYLYSHKMNFSLKNARNSYSHLQYSTVCKKPEFLEGKNFCSNALLFSPNCCPPLIHSWLPWLFTHEYTVSLV